MPKTCGEYLIPTIMASIFLIPSGVLQVTTDMINLML